MMSPTTTFVDRRHSFSLASFHNVAVRHRLMFFFSLFVFRPLSRSSLFVSKSHGVWAVERSSSLPLHSFDPRVPFLDA